MKKMSKKKIVWLCVAAVCFIIGMMYNLTEETDKQQEKPTATEQVVDATVMPTETADDARLDECCKAIADELNVKYKPEGFEIYGHASNGEALFSIDMPYTTDEVKKLYAHDKQSLRELWGDVARTTWDYLAEQNFDVPGDTEVVLTVFASDSNDCIVYITKNDTKLTE